MDTHEDNKSAEESEETKELVVGDEPKETWLTRQRRRVWRRAHYRFPNLIPTPFREDLVYQQERDQKNNLATHIPESEELRLRCIWGAELYGPSQIEPLYEGMKRLGWDKDSFGMPGRGAIDWIKNIRMYGSEGNFSIGVAHRIGETKWFPRDYFAPMPDRIDYLLVDIFQISASLTCVLVGFVMKEDSSTCYEAALQTNRKTTNERRKGQRGYSILDVGHLKKRSIDDLRRRHRRTAIQWFESHLPGLFCGATDGNRLPTAELVTLSNVLPFPGVDEDPEDRAEWTNLLSIERGLRVWVSDKCSGLRLSFDKLNSEARYHMIAALRVSDLSDKDLEGSGGRGHGAYVAYTHGQIEGILSRYAAIALLSEMRRKLNLSRESLKPSNHNRGVVLNTLESLEAFFYAGIGVPAVARELAEMSKKDRSFSWYCSGFSEQSYRKTEEKPDKISMRFQLQMSFLSKQLLTDEESTRELFQQFSSILSARESIKAQKRMEILAILAIFFALASVLLTLINHNLLN